MKRRPLAVLAVLVAALALPASAPAYTVGISDQQAITFQSPLFPQLKSKVARYIAPWDVLSDPREKQELDEWIAGATVQRQRILVHFEHSHRSISAGNKAPTVRKYTAALKAFRAAYPQVRDIGVWNEVNRKRVRGQNLGQPVAGKPKLLARYYKAARKVYRGSGAKIVALDVLDERNPRAALAMLRAFQRRIGRSLTRSMILGLHNYSDTNRFSTVRTRKVLRAFKGKEVWLTETGGIVSFGRSFPFNERRAARALGCMFRLARSNRRITRLYVYNYNAAPEGARFDAGLIKLDGTKRRGFDVVRKRKVGRC